MAELKAEGFMQYDELVKFVNDKKIARKDILWINDTPSRCYLYYWG